MNIRFKDINIQDKILTIRLKDELMDNESLVIKTLPNVGEILPILGDRLRFRLNIDLTVLESLEIYLYNNKNELISLYKVKAKELDYE